MNGFGGEAIHELAAEALASLTHRLRLRSPVCKDASISVQRTTDWALHPSLPPASESEGWWSHVSSSMTLQTSIEVEETDVYRHFPSVAGHGPVPMARKVACQDMHQAVGEALLCLCLAIPASIQTTGLLMVDSGPSTYRMSILRDGPNAAISEARHLGWPRVQLIDPTMVWDWMQSLPGFQLGEGRGRVGRALAAFSQLIEAEGRASPVDIVWAMMGLEALYAEGTQGLQTQLLEKAATLLGAPLAFKKRIKGVYGFRSRLVHGDVDLPYVHARRDTTGRSEGFDAEAGEWRHIAAAILLASLQQLALRGWNDLAFEYALVPPATRRDATSDASAEA